MEDCVEGAVGLPGSLHGDFSYLQVACLSIDRLYGSLHGIFSF